MIWLDLETYSEVPINVGTYRYAANCEVMLLAYAIDDGPVDVIDVSKTGTEFAIQRIAELCLRGELFTAHNAMFDRNALRLGSLKLEIPIERWRCTMAQALAHSLPGSLDKLCDVFRISEDQAKIKDGKQLVQLFCKPRPKNSKLRRATRLTHPQEWQRFVEYAAADVEAMRAISKKMPNWNYTGEELALWHLDQKINDRGFQVDVDFAKGAIEAVTREQKRLAKEVQDRTDNTVQSANQRDALLAHILEQYGVDLPDMTAATLERRANDPDLPVELRELIGIRLDASTTSTSKYKRLVNGVNDDNRLRGTIQFCGAARTGRDAGRVFQPQNLPRPSHEFEEIEQFIEAVKADCADLLFPDEVMGLASSSIRSAIIAPPGKKIVVCDLSNIEGRFAAWLAGEEWKLAAFRMFDAKQGEDLYKVAYGRAFKVAPQDVDKNGRQIGKVQELMLQYEGGVGAFVTGAATYRIDLADMTRLAWPAIPADVKEEAKSFLEWTIREKRNTFGLADDVFMCCDALKRLWRRSQGAIASYWPELKDAWIEACRKPGNTVLCRRVTFRVDGAWMKVQLPSGRFLCYPSPKVEEDGSISYMGVSQYSRKWCRLKTYGGKLLENITQAGSRDVFKHGEKLAEDDGFEVVLPVHDELVTEAGEHRTLAELQRCMSMVPAWAEGLPLAAAGFETYRYRKE